MKRLGLSIATLGALLLLAAPVAAAAPVVVEKHVQLTRFFPAEPLCEDFTVTSQFDVTRTVVQHYDENGNLLREARQIRFTGSQTNDENGTSLPVNGNFNQVFDFVEGTLTISGSARHVTVPGSGIVLHDAGRVVLSLASDSVVFMAGSHQDLLGDYTAICGALAGS